MTRFLSLIALLALVLFAVPVSAQEETEKAPGGQQNPTAQQQPTDQAAQPQQPGQYGAEHQPSGAAQPGQVSEQPGQTGVTQRAGEEITTPSETTPTETTTPEKGGAEMPTTASPLPLVMAAGAILFAAGVALRLASIRR
jgi:hypothetical protein